MEKWILSPAGESYEDSASRLQGALRLLNCVDNLSIRLVSVQSDLVVAASGLQANASVLTRPMSSDFHIAKQLVSSAGAVLWWHPPAEFAGAADLPVLQGLWGIVQALRNSVEALVEHTALVSIRSHLHNLRGLPVSALSTGALLIVAGVGRSNARLALLQTPCPSVGNTCR